MRVLLVTIRLALPGGSELYVRDVARALRARRHVPVVCSAHLGPVADWLRADGIPVVDDPARVAEAPDVIHGQHHLATMTALARFPTTPAVYFCHGFLPWEEAPPAHPAIRRWVAVSDLTSERLVSEGGVAPNRIDRIPNFVDLARFRPRGPLPARPRSALLLSNSAPPDGWVDDLRRVCAERGIVLDQLGLGCGRPVSDLEARLPAYDLVFARGRSALEAMAVGAAVVLCDVEGTGPLVDATAFADLQRGNFGLQVLAPTHDPARLAHEIDRYDPDEATRVRALVREHAGLDRAVDRILGVYARAIDDAAAAPSSAEAAQAALATYLRWVNVTMPSPRLEEREAVLAARHAAAAAVAAAEARGRETIAAAARDAAAALDAERERTAAVTHELAGARAETSAVRDELARLGSGRAVRVVLPLLWRSRQALLPEHSVRLRLVRGLLGRAPGPTDVLPTGSGASDAGCELSVVVLALGAPATLVDAVRSLREQQPSPEIVVVASGAGSDAVARLLRDRGLDVPVVTTTRRLLPGAARSVGIAATHARWIAFLAADCIATPGWVAGRVDAHGAGADVVASAVVQPRRWNPWATATQVLLFAARLPHTPPPARRLYGASYARTLFTRYGRFRPDLRAGEDSELHQRLASDATIVFRGDVRSVHRHPTRALDFARDQYRRGHRMARVHAALGSVGRRRVAANALARVLASFRTTARATPTRDWPALLWSAPWLLPGAAAYAAGALAAPVARARSVPSPRRRLVCLLQCHDDRRFLPDFLASVTPHVDGILALDDGSTDGSDVLLEGHPSVLELLRIAPRTPHVWDERRNKRLLLDAAARHGAEWAIALDADERVERGFRARADAVIDDGDRAGHLAFAVHLRELWDSPTRYRSDGIWGQKRVARLFRVLADHDPGAAALHGPWAPDQGRGPDGAFRTADLIVYHARMIDPADRAARRQRYETLDPDCRWQSIGYAYLTDEAGLTLADCPPDRGPEPLESDVPGPGRRPAILSD